MARVRSMVGCLVQHRTLGWQGRLERLDDDQALVVAAGKKFRCLARELCPQERRSASRGIRSRQDEALLRAGQSSFEDELNLIGSRVEPALDRLDQYLDRALLSNHPKVRVIHGHGTGRLRQAVREHLNQHFAVACHSPGSAGEGGNGATVVTLREP